MSPFTREVWIEIGYITFTNQWGKVILCPYFCIQLQSVLYDSVYSDSILHNRFKRWYKHEKPRFIHLSFCLLPGINAPTYSQSKSHTPYSHPAQTHVSPLLPASHPV